MNALRRILLLLAAMLGSPALAAEPMMWSASWTAPPAPPLAAAPNLPASAMSRAFRDRTLVQVVRLSRGGVGLRLRLTNEYGSKPLRIGAASVALVDARGGEIAGSRRAMRFGGRADALIPAHAPWFSDAVAMTVPARARLRVALYLPEDTGLCTCHAIGGATTTVSPPGDHTARSFVPESTFTARAFLSGVDVANRAAAPVVVAFGDSITDGYLSSVDADRRWPDRLAERIAADRRLSRAGIANAGLSGNRILLDGSIALFGESGLARFDRDVLSVPGASTVIVLLGINDIGQKRDGPPVTAEAMIDGYRQIVARARGRGLRVIGGTMLPYEGAAYYRAEGDAVRREVNRWILTAGAFDGVVDFDRVMRDPQRPSRIRAELQSGDWLHPNDAGYRAMGDAVALGLIR